MATQEQIDWLAACMVQAGVSQDDAQKAATQLASETEEKD
jgi:hypothetical protein